MFGGTGDDRDLEGDGSFLARCTYPATGPNRHAPVSRSGPIRNTKMRSRAYPFPRCSRRVRLYQVRAFQVFPMDRLPCFGQVERHNLSIVVVHPSRYPMT